MRIHNLLACLVMFFPLLVVAASGDVHEYALKNGMKVIIKEDHRAPVAVSQVWYKVGSSYEYGGITGASHVLEHMMFKGTKKYPAGEFSRIIAENGGKENAFTGQDYTAYFQQLEKSRLPVSFKMEADRMRNLLLQKEEFLKEIKVVMEERRMRTEDRPVSLAYERFKSAAFVSSPYHNPLIGWMNDLESLTIEDMEAWYDAWYAPNNATLVVAGDVEPKKVLKQANKYFGRIKARKVPALKPQREIEQHGMQRLTIKLPAKLPHLFMGYKVPVINTAKEDWEPYALDMLAGILSGGASARFPQRLVREQQVAAKVSAGYNPAARISDIFIIDGTPTQEHTAEELEKAVRGEVQRLRDELVSVKELDRVKAQVMASEVYERDSIFYQAMKIGTVETIGLEWKVLDNYLENIQAVTAEQVQAVARKYLVDDKLTVALLDPQPIENNKPRHTMQGGGSHAR